MEHVREKIERKYDVPRKAVFMDGYKLTVNGAEGTVEEFTKDGREIGQASNKTMLKKLVLQFKRFRGKEKFRLPGV